jgi:beta-1,4-mannosyl-glycoprotein beta-1,4-N-acetylglucosaminyltransferase
MKVVEAIPFFNEMDLLEIHLETHWNHIDLFLVTESTFTHTGKKKPLYLSDAKQFVEKYRKKLRIQVITELPVVSSTFEADWFHREQAKPILDKIMDPSSFLLYSDVDEIVKEEALAFGIETLSKNTSLSIVHFAQDLTYFFLNNLEISGKLLSYTGEYPEVEIPKWLGSNLSRWSFSKNMPLTDLRNPQHKSVGARIPNAGWHFSWVGGPTPTDPLTRVLEKLENTAHIEFNTWMNRWGLRRRIETGRDLVRRRGGKFKVSYDDGFLPPYVIANKERFAGLIYQSRN